MEYLDKEEYSFGLYKRMQSEGNSSTKGPTPTRGKEENKPSGKDAHSAGGKLKAPAIHIPRAKGGKDYDKNRRARAKALGQLTVAPEIIKAHAPSNTGATNFIGGD